MEPIQPVAAAVPDEQKYADQIYDRVKASIAAKRISVANVTIMLTMAMVEVEKVATLTGPQKKELVIHVVSRLVDEIPAEQEDKAAITAAVALFMPSIIDAIVAASKGQFGLNAGADAGGTPAKCCALC